MDNMEPETNKDNKNKKRRKNTKGFYIIFSLCMIAMIGAAWSAYASVSDYMQPSVPQTKSSEAETGEAASSSSPEETLPPTQPETARVENQFEQSLPDTTEAETEQETEAEQEQYFYPVGNELLKAYSAEVPIKSKTFGDYRTHIGCDYKSEKDASVHMMSSGTVKEIKTDEIMGGIVIVENNDGSVATYCGVTPNEGLKIGSHLSAGDVMGTIGEISGEKKDGYHLHLEMAVDGKPVDPDEFLNNHNAR